CPTIATKTFFAFPSIHGQAVLVLALFAATVDVVAEGRPAVLNAAPKHLANRGQQGFGLLSTRAVATHPRAQAGMKQCFAGIDVSQPCDSFLVKQSGLQIPFRT